MSARRFALFVLTVTAAVFAMGCTTGFMEDAARRSLSSLAIDILSTAVNETIDP